MYTGQKTFPEEALGRIYQVHIQIFSEITSIVHSDKKKLQKILILEVLIRVSNSFH